MTSMVDDLTRDIFDAENSDDINENNNNNTTKEKHDVQLKPSRNQTEIASRRDYVDDDINTIENTLADDNTKLRTANKNSTSKMTKKSLQLYRKETISNHTVEDASNIATNELHVAEHEEESRQKLDKDILESQKNDSSVEQLFNKDMMVDSGDQKNKDTMNEKDVLTSPDSSITQNNEKFIQEISMGGPIIQNNKPKKPKTWYKEFVIHTHDHPTGEDLDEEVGQITDNMMEDKTHNDGIKMQEENDDLVTVRGDSEFSSAKKVCFSSFKIGINPVSGVIAVRSESIMWINIGQNCLKQ